MKIEDAIFNWLQITVVYKARPNDQSAKETSEFFRRVLADDHNISDINYELDGFTYNIRYEIEGKEATIRFNSTMIDKLITDIENESKYN